MRYDVFPLVSDLKGRFALGEFTPPKFIPDPRKSDISARIFIEIWIAWAADREQKIREWATTIDNLIATKSATCAAIREYNDAAIALYVREVEMGERFILGGISRSDLPPPFFPLVFASSTRTKSINFKLLDWPTGRLTIEYDLPCPPVDPFGPNPDPRLVFPDFSKLRVFGDPRDVASVKTPSGLGALQAVGWAAVVLGAALGATAVLSIREAFRGVNNTELAEINGEIVDKNFDADFNRANENRDCVDDSLRKLGRELTVSELLSIRTECARIADGLFPRAETIAEPKSFGFALLLGGVGIAAIVGSIAYFRRE